MPFTLAEFAALRPWACHLTSAGNFPSIRASRQIQSAAVLIGLAGLPHLLTWRRPGHRPIQVHGTEIQLRDQQPLHAGNVALHDGWRLSDLVNSLNQRVFSWPGTSDGPIRPGQNHFAHYQSEGPKILRAPMLDLLKGNAGLTPLFCRFNSGSPGYSNRTAGPRGSNTFVSAGKFIGRPSEVIELTLSPSVALPASVQWGLSAFGPWPAF